jgi:hypothetical protein
VELKHFERVRKTSDGLLDRVAVLANDRFGSGFYFGDDGNAITRGSPWIDWAVSAILDGEVSLLRNRHRLGCGRINVFLGCDCLCCHIISFEDHRLR